MKFGPLRRTKSGSNSSSSSVSSLRARLPRDGALVGAIVAEMFCLVHDASLERDGRMTMLQTRNKIFSRQLEASPHWASESEFGSEFLSAPRV